jgi:hypothetical protein
MQENPAGIYTGSYTVSKDINVTGAAVLAKLQVGQSVSPIIQANGTVTIDSVPPQVTEYSPGNGSAVNSNLPQIYGTISDRGGLGIEPARVRIDLDGSDMTSQATVTPVFFNLQLPQPLPEGTHTVRVRLQDRAGNESETHWSFSVSSNRVVREFTSDAENQGPVSDGSTISFTLKATPGGRATFGIGNLARDVPMKESSPGVYNGSYTVHAGQDIKNAPVTATFIDNSGARVQSSLRSGITIAAGPPSAPVILSPENGANVGATLNIRGKSAPDSTVDVNVEFSSKVLGGFMSVNGAVASKEVKADGRGEWEVDDISMQPGSMLGSASTRVYTITAIAQNAAGETSDPTKITVRP